MPVVVERGLEVGLMETNVLGLPSCVPELAVHELLTLRRSALIEICRTSVSRPHACVGRADACLYANPDLEVHARRSPRCGRHCRTARARIAATSFSGCKATPRAT